MYFSHHLISSVIFHEFYNWHGSQMSDKIKNCNVNCQDISGHWLQTRVQWVHRDQMSDSVRHQERGEVHGGVQEAVRHGVRDGDRPHLRAEVFHLLWTTVSWLWLSSIMWKGSVTKLLGVAGQKPSNARYFYETNLHLHKPLSKILNYTYILYLYEC